MATPVIRNVEPELYARPKAQAALQGRWMGEETRVLLHWGVAAAPMVTPGNFG
nr:hypothetical protein [uncultured Rhodopila sp.]